MGPSQASAPLPDVGNTFSWGDEAQVREVLEDAFERDVEVLDTVHPRRRPRRRGRRSPPPTARRRHSRSRSDHGRRHELERSWIELYESYRDESGAVVQHRRYLRVLAVRR